MHVRRGVRYAYLRLRRKRDKDNA
jgi:hypothetical protein